MKIASVTRALFLLAMGCAATLRAEIPPLLSEALNNEEAHEGRWAYTETVVTRDRKGAQKSITVVRYDPSKIYAEQYTPLMIDGAAPSKKVLKQYRERGEQEATARQKQLENPDETEKTTPRIDLGGPKGLVDLPHATIEEETDRSITYRTPVRAEGKSHFPFEKIQILIRVNKQQRAFEHISLKVLAPFRMKLIAKVKSVEIDADYTAVDDKYPPQASSIDVNARLSILFAKFDQHDEVRRTDFKHVKSYDDRCSVNAGPLKTLGF